MERIIPIKETPLSISVYSVKDKPLHMHDAGMLEIIFCLAGSVTFSYAYEEFTLNGGEYISVDRDAYYMHSDEYNICVSFFIDLTRFKEKYPNIIHTLFVCEGCECGTTIYPTEYHDKLKGKLITLLKVILDADPDRDARRINSLVESVVDLFVWHFDIVLFHSHVIDMKEESLLRYQEICAYIDTHSKDKILLGDLAAHLGLSSGYLSSVISRSSIGFSRLVAYFRANKSERYLISTNLTIVEISEECGFSDPQYYYKAFREWYKCTPRQFRSNYIRQSKDNMVYHSPDVIGDIVDGLMTEHYINMFED